MKLLKAIGLIGEPKLSPDVRGTLMRAAESFLRGGGTLTLDDWADLSDDERDAFVLAGDNLYLDRAARIGIACGGPAETAAEFLRATDGGVALRQMLLKQLVDHAAEKIGSKANG